jgi:hypothetical protein
MPLGEERPLYRANLDVVETSHDYQETSTSHLNEVALASPLDSTSCLSSSK